MDNDSRSGSRERKRAQFTDAAGSKRKATPAMIAILAALVIVAVYVVIKSTDQQPSATSITQPSGAGQSANSNSDIHIPLAEVSDGRAKFFDYRTPDNRQLRFFVMKSSDGIVRAALDACDTCYHAKRGYHQEGDEMVCNNCGLRFPSALINEVKGACNPVGLPRTVEGDQLVIKAADLNSRSSYF